MSRQKSFELNQYHRDALTSFIGKVVKYFIPEDDEIEKFKQLEDALTADDINQLILVYEFLDDCFTYRMIKSSQLKVDMPVLKKMLKFADEHDMFNEDWDLIDAAEMILEY